MCKFLLLQELYGLSNRIIMEKANLNLAFLYFVGLNPEDPLPDRSSLSKFRRNRLGQEAWEGILREIVRQCSETGIVKRPVGSTNAKKRVDTDNRPTPMMKLEQLARKLSDTSEEV